MARGCVARCVRKPWKATLPSCSPGLVVVRWCRRSLQVRLTGQEILDTIASVAGTVAAAHETAEHIAADIRECMPNSDVLVHIEPRSHERVDGS